jgi:hypothetical protein
MSARGETFDDKGPLPPGWKTKMDPQKKRRFYYNRSTNVTSWHRPKPATQPQEETAAPTHVQRAPGPAINFSVISLTGHELQITTLSSQHTVGELKQEVAGASGSRAEHLRLVLNDQPLDDQQRTLGECGVVTGSTMHAVPQKEQAAMPAASVSRPAAMPAASVSQPAAQDSKRTTLRVTMIGELGKALGPQFVELDVAWTDTVHLIKNSLQQKVANLTTVHGAKFQERFVMADQQQLSVEVGQVTTKLDSRETVKDAFECLAAPQRQEMKAKQSLRGLKSKASQMGMSSRLVDMCEDADDPKMQLIEEILKMQFAKIPMELDCVSNGCIGGHGSCIEWTCFFFFGSLGVIFIGCLLAMGVAVALVPEEVEEVQHYLFVGSFMGVWAACSMVCFIARLVPRYTGKRGITGNQKQIDKLARETWIWSFTLNGQGAKIKVLIGLWLAGIKFSQLFTLTYDPSAISGLPDWAVEVGEYTLFDFQSLVAEENSTANVAISDVFDVGAQNNLTAGATEALADGYEAARGFVSGEDRYYNFFVFYSFVCVAVLVLVCICWPCLTGTGSESWERKATMIVGTIQGFVAIPLYTHLLAGLDCTYEDTGWGPYGNESGFRWDGETDAFGFQSDAEIMMSAHNPTTAIAGDHSLISEEEAKRSCYGSWTDASDGENWTAFNYMVFGMIAICIFHWPVTLFLMAKSDSERDDDQAVTMIVDAIIRAKMLPGRKMTNVPTSPAVAGTPRGEPDNHEDKYEEKKGCCRKLKPKPGYENAKVDYVTDGMDNNSKAREEYEKLWKFDAESEKKYTIQVQKLEVKLKRPPTDEEIAKRKIAKPEKIPSMNRLELRQYAVDQGVSPAEIERIDHRHACFWQMRDLDSADEGIKGPKKRPREAAINFGLEVAIVVVSALFSGQGEVQGVTVGKYCTWPDPLDPWADTFKMACGDLATEATCLSDAGQMHDTDDEDAVVCVWEDRPWTVMETKLAVLAVIHLIMAYYFCNPGTLLCGEVCCSPYRNKDQTDSRTTSCQFGYPYNWEPLNFVRSATSLVCSSFAAFEILSYRKFFADMEEEEPAVVPGEGEGEDEDEDVGLAMEYWVYSCMGIAAFYVTMCLIRWCVFRSHKRRTEKKNKKIKKEVETKKQKTRTQRKHPSAAANP